MCCTKLKEIKEYKNALVFGLTFPGIPIVYYGSEQEFNGCGDPTNREPLWTSNYNMSSPMYAFIKTVVTARKEYTIWDYNFTIVEKQTNFFAYNRGNVMLVCLTNIGDKSGNKTYNFQTSQLNVNGEYCNIFDPTQTDCFVYKNDNISISLINGEPKVYVVITQG